MRIVIRKGLPIYNTNDSVLTFVDITEIFLTKRQNSKIKNTTYDVIIGICGIEDTIIKTRFKNLSVIPANIELAGAEIELQELDENFIYNDSDFLKKRVYRLIINVFYSN